jgi:hypothetical protein
MLKKFVAALGLLATVAYARDSEAGCGVTLTFVNQSNEQITVLEVESRVSGATWAAVMTADVSVGAHANVARAIDLKTGCAPPHDIRVKYKKGASTLYETMGPVATMVDKKISINLK